MPSPATWVMTDGIPSTRRVPESVLEGVLKSWSCVYGDMAGGFSLGSLLGAIFGGVGSYKVSQSLPAHSATIATR